MIINADTLNAHILLPFIFVMRDELSDHPECFVPWMMGSQTCEQMFHSLRSMSGTFSTMINFSLYTRLHKLSIKNELDSHGIKFPRLNSHQKKTGYGLLVQHFQVK